ncbi:MAG: NnrS family protein [Terriglobales bacterium]
MHITPETTIPEIVRACPSARRVFDRHGLRGCGGEHGPNESLAFFAQVHEVDLDLLMRQLRAEMERPGPTYQFRETLEDYIYRRFFKAGIAITLTLGVLWGAINLLQIGLAGSFLQLRLLPSIHAHAHAMVYGWVGLFVMGFAYQSFPRFKNTRLWRPDLASLSFYLMLTGIGARVAAEMLAPRAVAFAFGALSAAVELVALALFVAVLVNTARRSVGPRVKYEKFIFGSVFWFVVGTVLTHIFFFAKLTAANKQELVMRIATIDGPLRDAQLLGFAALIIAGVSQRFVPQVYALPRPRRDRQRLIFILMNASLLLNIASYVGVVTTHNPLFAIGLEAAYLLMPVWAVLLVKQLGIFSRPSQPDRTFKFIRAAYTWLLVSCFMMPFFLLYGRATGQAFAHSYMGAHRHAFTVGFISFMILGVAGRVVPILAGVDGSRISSLWGPFILLTAGNIGRVTLQIATDFTPRAFPLVGVTGFVELTALTWWGIEMWRTMDLARTHRPSLFGAPPASLHREPPIQIASAS